MAEQLTPQQYAAVHDRGGRLLVSAAAGSGKTKVLVDRLMQYLLDPVNPANIDDFLIITFTKAAAAELRSKIAVKLSEQIALNPGNRHLQRQLQRLYMTQISTVHSFCATLLRKYAYRLDVAADFRVAEENEAAQLRRACMEKVLDSAYEKMDEDFAAFLDTFGLGRNDDNLADILLKIYDSAMCHLDPMDWLDQCVFDECHFAGADVSQTQWGGYLLQHIKEDVAMYLPAFQRCAQLADTMPGEQKAAALLHTTHSDLQRICNCDTWDMLFACKDIDFGRLTFTKKADPALADQIKTVRTLAVKQIRATLSLCTQTSEGLLRDLKKSVPAVRCMTAIVKQFIALYDTEKHRRRMMDYTDLEQKTLDLLLGKGRHGPTAFAKEVGRGYREVMVDEYQDANAVQDSIYMALTEERHNCFMVGDVKQSIYQFRLADPEIFLKKYHTYVAAEEAVDHKGRKIVLSSNFRSGGEVLSAANAVFHACMSPKVGGVHYGQEEALHEGVPHVSLEESAVELYCVEVSNETYAEEAAFVAERIAQLLDGTHMVRDKDALRPIKAGDIAILLRSPKTNGHHFTRELARYGVRTTGGTEDLMEAREVQLLRCALQVIQNPRMDIPLTAVLLSPVFGMTADDLAHIRSEDRFSSLYDALLKSSHTMAGEVVSVIKKLRGAAPMLNVSELIEEFFALTRMDAVFSAMPDGKTAVENLNILCQIAAGFDGQGAGSLDLFLDHLNLLSEKGVGAASDSAGDDCVTIISIHSSKGLEYPVVVLSGLAKSFNTDGHHGQVLCNKALGIGVDSVDHKNRVKYPTIAKRAISVKMSEDDLSEEMRILYVAMTRARDRLIMTYAASNLESQLQQILYMDRIGCEDHVIRQTNNMGRWVLLAALRRTEAGALFALAGNHPQASVSQDPWLIRVVQGAPATMPVAFTDVTPKKLPIGYVDRISSQLNYVYPYHAATVTPSKRTATQLKGRQKDEESAENTEASRRTARIFPGKSQKGGTQRGSAMHLIMQHLDFTRCEDMIQIKTQLDGLVDRGIMTRDQAELVDVCQISSLFDTDIGKRLATHRQLLREFKFSVLEDASVFDPSLVGEQILMQGVVDCAMVDDDGIVIIDFKTDHVIDGELQKSVDRYSGQVDAYARALSRIYQRPVKEKWLYFFSIGEFVGV